MRVISGKYRGAKILSPDGNDVRPTTDKIKETMFNILVNKKSFYEASVLDVFAGSGALGLEALSRGASRAIFCDSNRASANLTKMNLKRVQEPYQVFNSDFRIVMKKLVGKKFDFIFADPPYASGYYEEVLFLAEKYDLLAKNGIIILEYSASDDLLLDDKRYIIDTRKCGTIKISFLTAREEE